PFSSAEGAGGSASNPCRPSRSASAMPPRPPPRCHRRSRRESIVFKSPILQLAEESLEAEHSSDKQQSGRRRDRDRIGDRSCSDHISHNETANDRHATQNRDRDLLWPNELASDFHASPFPGNLLLRNHPLAWKASNALSICGVPHGTVNFVLREFPAAEPATAAIRTRRIVQLPNRGLAT